MADKVTKQDWQAAAAREVKGKPLVWRTQEGIDVQALYTAEDVSGVAKPVSREPSGLSRATTNP